MPIYEFYCLSCGRTSEKVLPITDATQNIMCPVCDEHTAQRRISKSTFHLKGSGFYATDYGKPSASKNAQEDAAGDTPSTGRRFVNKTTDKSGGASA